MKNNKLDNIDCRILRALQNNGRLQNTELAEQVGLSCSACLRRVNILEEKGVIDRYVALLSPSKINCPVTVYVLGTFFEEDYKKRERFIFEMKLIPQVNECHLIAGEWDFILKLYVKDLEEFHKIRCKYLNESIGIKNVKSEIILKTIKNSTELPL